MIVRRTFMDGNGIQRKGRNLGLGRERRNGKIAR